VLACIHPGDLPVKFKKNYQVVSKIQGMMPGQTDGRFRNIMSCRSLVYGTQKSLWQCINFFLCFQVKYQFHWLPKSLCNIYEQKKKRVYINELLLTLKNLPLNNSQFLSIWYINQHVININNLILKYLYILILSYNKNNTCQILVKFLTLKWCHWHFRSTVFWTMWYFEHLWKPQMMNKQLVLDLHWTL
jgi:hypothetical protein